ncbi:radical SAM protein, partial [Candidatus Gracilibacteria bacterium]|nr:radical SAM protein [Candidatus Gracilibacteria bacterium]
MSNRDTHSFYIHIPFCKQKCTYCKFALTPIFDDLKKQRYLAYLKQEIEDYFLDYPTISLSYYPTTLYFGGGTPSILTLSEIQEILLCFPGIEDTREITIECNPEDITTAYKEGLIKLGVNRISLGVQTLNDTSLKEIGRGSVEGIYEALNILSGVTNSEISLNVDFILGLPYVKSGEILQGIKLLHKKYPYITHTSVYMLEDEKYPKHWKEYSITETELQTEFTEILEYFEGIGWNHYELSNFSKPGYESMHNQSYWNHSNYRGFGLSAASFEDGKRWTHARSFSGYYAGKRIDEEYITEEQKRIETMMFGLRTSGIEIMSLGNEP